MKNRKAFSLFELSISILIISLLVAGITKGVRMLNVSRLQSAQSLTLSSPVSNINGLVLWFESSLPESFLITEAYDEAQITTWNNINPLTKTKYHLSSTASSGITYKEFSDIHKIPSIYFNGTSSAVLTLNDVAGNTPIFTKNNAFSFFILSKLDDDSSLSKVVFSNGESSGWGFGLSGAKGSKKRQFVFLGGANNESNTATATSKAEVVSAIYSGGSDGAIKLFTNGLPEVLDSATSTVPSPDGSLVVGNLSSANAWSGYISEIIIFNRALNDFDRKQVEQYLGQKYAISVSQ
jgi:hypothetical protein